MIKNDQKNRVADFFRSERRRLIFYVQKWIDDTAERDGEDIVQDVALSIFSQADITAPIENLSAYIYRALHNRVADLIKKRKLRVISLDSGQIRPRNFSLSALIFDLRDNAEKQLDQKEMHRRLYEAIGNLNDKDRAVVIATELEGRTFKELARQWEIPVGTLLARKHRAVKKIRKLLET